MASVAERNQAVVAIQTFADEMQAAGVETDAIERWVEREVATIPPRGERFMDDEQIIFDTPPLSYLNDVDDFLRWRQEVGPDTASKLLTEATREYMQEHGTRSVLKVVERMDDVIAIMEEQSP